MPIIATQAEMNAWRETMFGRRKKKKEQFVFDIDSVIGYFEDNHYVGTRYRKTMTAQDHAEREIVSYLNHMEWIRGYEAVGINYVIYHGRSRYWSNMFFKRLKEVAQNTTGTEGVYNNANMDIENFVIRDSEGMTFYMLRVGEDLITTCVEKEREEEIKRVFENLNTFINKRVV